jgi:hypothetical protein
MSVRPVRITGRALQRARADLFGKNRWCVLCEADGRHTRATIRDHILPLAEGGTDDVENTQGLCLDCWDAKKEAEARRGLQNPGVRNDFRKASAPRDANGLFTERRATRERDPDAPEAGRPTAVSAAKARPAKAGPKRTSVA